MALNEPGPFRGDDPLQKLLDLYLLSGDDEAMEEIVSRTRGKLLSVARRIGNPQDAEDAVQQAYFSLIRKRGERLEAPVLPWLLTAVVRIAYRQKAVHQRQHLLARRLSRPPRTESPLPDIVTAEQVGKLRREIARLPSKYRDPVVLRLLQGLSTHETATLLGVPEPTVRTRLHRARLLLRSRWPSPVAYGFFVLPWVVADAGRAAGEALAGASFTAPAFLATVAAVGALGTAGGLALAPRRGEPGPAREPGAAVVRSLERRRDDLAAERTALEAEAARLAAERRRLRERRDRAAATLADLTRVAGGTEARHEVPIPALNGGRDLGRVDWGLLGENLVELTRVLCRLVEKHADGTPTTHEDLQVEKRRRNYALLREAVKVWDELPSDANAVPHTHPVFIANAIAAALDYLELPLSDAQRDRFAAEVESFERADAARRAGYTEGTRELTRLREESELRERSLEAFRAILTAEQRAAVFPEATRGWIGLDLYSQGLMWAGMQRVQTVTFTDREHLVEKLTAILKGPMLVSESEEEEFGRIVTRWVEELPDETLRPVQAKLVYANLMEIDELHAAARRTETLFSRVEAGLPPNRERSVVLRYSTGVLVPRVLTEDGR